MQAPLKLQPRSGAGGAGGHRRGDRGVTGVEGRTDWAREVHIGKPGGKVHPQVHGNEEDPGVHPCVLAAAQAGTPGCSRLGHSQKLTFAAPISWERSCAANEHMKGFISAPGTNTDCKIPDRGSSSVSIPGRPSAPQHKNHREMGFLHEISFLLLGCL